MMHRNRSTARFAVFGGGAWSTAAAASKAGRFLPATSLSAGTIGMGAVTLVVLAAMLVAGRIGWRLGMIVLIGCGALLGGSAMLDGIQTAIAVSP
jgi:type IV secretory pathway VirB2 component (pilin)